VNHNAAMMGQFLSSRRRRLVRAHLGVPPITGRTTSGLRREEVAYLAGVSITWYTWLEQGRDVTPSRQVLDSLAQTLRLSHAEHVYLLSLAGYSAPHPAEDPSPGAVPAHVQRLLDALADYQATRYALEAGSLFVETGWWRHRRNIVPVRKIQSVDLTESWWSRMFGICTLKLGVAGGSGFSDHHVPALTRAEAQSLRAELLS